MCLPVIKNGILHILLVLINGRDIGNGERFIIGALHIIVIVYHFQKNLKSLIVFSLIEIDDAQTAQTGGNPSIVLYFTVDAQTFIDLFNGSFIISVDIIIN